MSPAHGRADTLVLHDAQGHRLEYSEVATRDAAAQVRAFLDGALKD